MTDNAEKLEEGWYWVRRRGFKSREVGLVIEAASGEFRVCTIADEDESPAEKFHIGPRIQPPQGDEG